MRALFVGWERAGEEEEDFPEEDGLGLKGAAGAPLALLPAAFLRPAMPRLRMYSFKGEVPFCNTRQKQNLSQRAQLNAM